VVLGMATSYGWDTLRNFVVSLRYSGYTVRARVCRVCCTCCACACACAVCAVACKLKPAIRGRRTERIIDGFVRVADKLSVIGRRGAVRGA
jgi:L-lactate utilization protein LutB